MITFERTGNAELVRQIMTHPQIWPHISDDCSPTAEEFQPIMHRHFWYILARHEDTDTLLGLWLFTPQNGVCWEVHTCLLPVAWGMLGQSAARALPAWIWENTPCRRIITNVPAGNPLALQFAQRAGMKVYGVNEGSYLKHGVLRDQTCLGLSKPAPRVDAEQETAECRQQ